MVRTFQYSTYCSLVIFIIKLYQRILLHSLLVRTSLEIEEGKENFLVSTVTRLKVMQRKFHLNSVFMILKALASKRKRQQLRIKGTKEIFTPLREPFEVPPEQSGDSEIILPDLACKAEDNAQVIESGKSGSNSRTGGAPLRPSFLGSVPGNRGVIPARSLLHSSSISKEDEQADSANNYKEGENVGSKLSSDNGHDNSNGGPGLLAAPVASGGLSSAAAKRKASLAAPSGPDNLGVVNMGPPPSGSAFLAPPGGVVLSAAAARRKSSAAANAANVNTNASPAGVPPLPPP